MNIHIKTAARLSQVLGHGCSPVTDDFESIEALADAMRDAADAHDLDLREKGLYDYLPGSCRWGVFTVEPGPGTVLQWRTGSGRMGLTLDPTGLHVHLYSPACEGGMFPFLSVRIRPEGSVSVATFGDAIATIRAKPERVGHIVDFLAPALGDDGPQTLLDALNSDGDDGPVIADLILELIAERLRGVQGTVAVGEADGWQQYNRAGHMRYLEMVSNTARKWGL